MSKIAYPNNNVADAVEAATQINAELTLIAELTAEAKEILAYNHSYDEMETLMKKIRGAANKVKDQSEKLESAKDEVEDEKSKVLS